MSWIRGVVALASVGLALALPAGAEAQQAIETIRCESTNDRHQQCAYRASGVVTVHVKQQLSSARCVFNENWGTYDGGVWVDYGCRALFEVRRPPQTPSYRPAGGTFKSITCESREGRRAECLTPGIDPSSVTVERKLSGAECYHGRTWGATTSAIWVDQGCRAIFAYTASGSSYTPYNKTPYDHDVPCESLRGEWVHCEVSQIYVARVDRIAGNTQCDSYKAWGVDDTGIWVRSNCQGVWRVRYRH